MKYSTLQISKIGFLRSIVCIVLSVFLYSTHAQNNILDRTVSIELQNESLTSALSKLEEKADCKFSYSPTHFEGVRAGNKVYTNLSLSKILSDLLSAFDVYYRVDGNAIRIQVSGHKAPATSNKRKGTIIGQVSTRDGQPAAYVTILLKGTDYGTATNEEGKFSLEAPEGEYTLVASFVGLEKRELPVTISSNERGVVHIELREDSQTLKQVIVEARKYQTNMFAHKNSEHVARMALDNLENPQVYSVVDEDLIREQMAVTLEESFRNVPGAAPAKTGAGMPAFFSRGFQTSDNLRNGMATSLRTGIDLALVDRVETIKGPSSTLFGSTMVSFGGLVNYITKKPYEEFGGEVTYTHGNWEFRRLTLDFNTPLKNNSVLFRFNGAIQSNNSFQDQGTGNTFVAAPSFTYQINDKLTFRIDADVQSFKGTSNTAWAIGGGVEASSYDELNLNYDRSLIDNSFIGHQLSSNISAESIYELNDEWTSRTLFTMGNGNYNDLFYFNQNWIDNNTIARAMGVFSPDVSSRKQFQQNFNGDFKIGGLRNRMVIGFDIFSHYRNFKYSYLQLDTVNIQESSPDMRVQTIENRLGNISTPIRIDRQSTYSAYFSNVLNLTDQLLVMLSLRVDRFVNKG